MAATHTPNLNLAKPDREDYVSVVTAINDNMDILDAAYGNQDTLRVVPFAIDRSAWTASNGGYAATFTSAYVTATSKDIFVGAPGAALSPIIMEKHSGGGGIDCWTEQLPTTTIDGTLYVIDSPDGKIPVIIEDTTIGVANGGTGQSTVAGVQSTFGIGSPSELHTSDKTNLVAAVNEVADHLAQLNFAKVTGTMASAVNTEVTVAFPTGYTYDNCVIVGYLNKNSNSAWYSNGEAITCFTGTQGVRIKTSDSGFTSMPFVAMLMKIPS